MTIYELYNNFDAHQSVAEIFGVSSFASVDDLKEALALIRITEQMLEQVNQDAVAVLVRKMYDVYKDHISEVKVRVAKDPSIPPNDMCEYIRIILHFGSDYIKDLIFNGDKTPQKFANITGVLGVEKGTLNSMYCTAVTAWLGHSLSFNTIPVNLSDGTFGVEIGVFRMALYDIANNSLS